MAERPIERMLSIAQDVKRCGDAEGYTAVENNGSWRCQAPIESFKVVTPPKEWRYITGIAPEPGAVMRGWEVLTDHRQMKAIGEVSPADWAQLTHEPPGLAKLRFEILEQAKSRYGTRPGDESEAEPYPDIYEGRVELPHEPIDRRFSGRLRERGLFRALTHEQKQAVRDYRGPENIGGGTLGIDGNDQVFGVESSMAGVVLPEPIANAAEHGARDVRHADRAVVGEGASSPFVVTREMIEAARAVCSEHGVEYVSRFMLEPIYRAMSAAAPSDDLAAANERLLHAWHRAEHRANAATSERDAALARAKAADKAHTDLAAWCRNLERIRNDNHNYLDGVKRMLTARGRVLSALLKGEVTDVALVDAFVEDDMTAAGWVHDALAGVWRSPRVTAEQQGNHPYHGPAEKREIKDEGGNVIRTERRAVPDAVHERFHGAIGDVLAGKVIPEARKQMQDALGKAPKHQKSDTTSTDAPMPGKAIGFKRAAVGLFVPLMLLAFVVTAQAGNVWDSSGKPLFNTLYEGLTFKGKPGTRVVTITIPAGGKIEHLDIVNDGGTLKITKGSLDGFYGSLLDAITAD